MSAIEGSKLSGEYPAMVKPYRDVLAKFGPDGFRLLLTHDSRHFISPLSTALAEVGQPRFLSGNFFQDVLPVLTSKPVEIADAIKDIAVPEDAGNRKKKVIEQARGIAPYLKDYLPIHADSVGFIYALRNGNTSDEERFLLSLSQRRAELPAICEYMGSRLIGQGTELAVDGLAFVVLQNMLVNAQKHGIQEDGFSSETLISQSDGGIKVVNLAPYPIPSNIVSRYSFDTGHYGLFIADMYATLAGKKLGFECEPVDIATGGEKTNYKVAVTF